jgi:DNA-binding transcriptional regulator YiaG
MLLPSPRARQSCARSTAVAIFRGVKGDEIKALRKELRCTTHELAAALGVTHELVMGWEEEQKFPTRAHVEHMQRLKAEGPGAVPRKRRGRPDANAPQASPLALLAEPAVWALFRKVLAHAELRAELAALAQKYPDV